MCGDQFLRRGEDFSKLYDLQTTGHDRLGSDAVRELLDYAQGSLVSETQSTSVQNRLVEAMTPAFGLTEIVPNQKH